MSKNRYCPDCGSSIRYRARSCDVCGTGKGWGVRQPIEWVTDDNQRMVGLHPDWLEKEFRRIERLHGVEPEVPTQFCCHLCNPQDNNFVDDSFICNKCNQRTCDFHHSVEGICMNCTSI